MEDAPEENKNIAETPKAKKQVKWKEEEPEKKVQRKQKTPEKLQYKPKQQTTTKNAAPGSKTQERKEKIEQKMIHEKYARNNEDQPRQQILHGQRT